MPHSSKQRLFRLLRNIGIACLLGSAYALICTHFGVNIPCPFRKLTGFLCPGCGVSRLCLCLLHLDFAGAWAANPVIFSLLPLAAVLALRFSIRYVKSGCRRLTKTETVLTYAACAVLLVYGVVRNL
ncbi:MAG: DUF2752 domain-containing protein [Faecousia sp.]